MDKLQLTTSGSTSPSAEEMFGCVIAANLDRLDEAMPSVVDKAMREVLPHRYTPELARQIADDIMARLRRAAAPEPLTARQRGTEWMLRWNCPPWCINDHTDPTSPEFHSAAPVETDLRTTHLENGLNDSPWLTAEVVAFSDKPQAYGRETRVLLGYGDHLAELTPAKARNALEAMRGFVPLLESVVDLADEIAADDFEGDPEIAAADKEAEDRRVGRITGAAA
ncbi:DUF6907 domain-containing protein [Streptomyces sp. NPDC001858]